MTIVKRYIQECFDQGLTDSRDLGWLRNGVILETKETSHTFYSDWFSERIIYEVIKRKDNGEETKEVHILDEKNQRWLSFQEDGTGKVCPFIK